jgi:hypothetical protein
MVAIGAFLPWLTATAPFVGTISRSLMSGADGVVLVAVGVLGGFCGLALLLPGSAKAARVFAIVSLLLVLLALGTVVVDYGDVSGRVANAMASSSFISAEVGPGPYVAGIGILAWVVGGLMALFGRHSP